MPLKTGNIALYMGPSDLDAKDDLEAAIMDFIGGASKTLDVAVQEIDAEPIVLELIKARQRKVVVRVMLESSYLHSSPKKPTGLEPKPNSWKKGAEANRYLGAALMRAGCEVRLDLNKNIFHQKFVVRDLKKRSRALLTGSTNFTGTGTHKNFNHLVWIDDKRVAQVYAQEFEEIWGGTFGARRLRHDAKPAEIRVSGVRIKPLFAPDHSPEMEIMKQMLKAKSRIDFAIFTFSQTSGIDDTMFSILRGRTVKIKGVMDYGMGNRPWTPARPLKEKGADLKMVRKGGKVNKLHHKLMVIDEEVVIAGSFNYTSAANQFNDENIVIIGDLDEKRAQSRTRQKLLAAYAKAEIDRIYEKYGSDLP